MLQWLTVFFVLSLTSCQVRTCQLRVCMFFVPSRYFQQVCTAWWRMESFSANKLIGQKSHLQSTSIKLRCLAAFSQNLAKSQHFWLIFNETSHGSDAAYRSQQLKSSLLYILVVFVPLWLPVVSFCDLLCNQCDLMSHNGSCYLNSKRPPPRFWCSTGFGATDASVAQGVDAIIVLKNITLYWM